jgi:hypothetical protein
MGSTMNMKILRKGISRDAREEKDLIHRKEVWEEAEVGAMAAEDKVAGKKQGITIR